MDINAPTTKPVDEKALLHAMDCESTFDTILEDVTMPTSVYEQIKAAQREWQEWMDAKAVELAIDPAKLKEARNY